VEPIGDVCFPSDSVEQVRQQSSWSERDRKSVGGTVLLCS
jgi:hypothetical protein